MEFFVYGRKEIETLSNRDKVLGEAIDEIGMIQRKIIPDTFSALSYSVVGQQISGKATNTVWNRLTELCGGITPENIGKLNLLQIQGCGMSMRKAGYIKGIAEAALDGSIDFKAFPAMTDKALIESLTKLRGVGIWTVEMLLMFSLGRPDIVSYNDLGIRKGMMKLYQLENLTKNQFEQYRKRYSPFGTVASFYLWEVAAR